MKMATPLGQANKEKFIEALGLFVASEKHITDSIRDTPDDKLKGFYWELQDDIRHMRRDFVDAMIGDVPIPNEVWCHLKHAAHLDINLYELIQRIPPDDQPRFKKLVDVANLWHNGLLTLLNEYLPDKMGEEK